MSRNCRSPHAAKADGNRETPHWPGVEAWVFDLDNTLYPAATTVYRAVEARMTAHIACALKVEAAEAARLRDRYFLEYGATVVGLVRHHRLDPHRFLNDAHDVDLSMLEPDLELNALIAALPGRKFVFTNGGARYARAVLAKLELSGRIERICDIESARLVAKPAQGAYDALVAHCAIDPTQTALVEDSARNLAPAHKMGFHTVLIDPERGAHPAFADRVSPDLKSFLATIV